MGELGVRLYVMRAGGQKESCPLYDTIGEASGLVGSLPLVINGRTCYAPLCAIGASEMISGRVERSGGVKMALSRTGQKAQDPSTPTEPPKPPTPTWKPLGTTTLRVNPWGAGGTISTSYKPGQKLITSEGDFIWTANFLPVIPAGAVAVRVGAFANGINNVHLQKGGTDFEIPAAYRQTAKRLSAYVGVASNQSQAGATISLRDERGAFLSIPATAVFNFTENPVHYGYRFMNVAFSITWLG